MCTLSCCGSTSNHKVVNRAEYHVAFGPSPTEFTYITELPRTPYKRVPKPWESIHDFKPSILLMKSREIPSISVQPGTAVETLKISPLPRVYQGAALSWGGVKNWANPEYLKKLPGFERDYVPVTFGSSVKSESRMMTLRLFVKQYLQTPLKCEDSLTPPRISDHLLFDQYPRLRIDYDPYIGKPYLPLDYPPPEYRVTIGPKNTTRGIVRNLSHKVTYLTQLVGYQHVRVYPPSEEYRLYPQSGYHKNRSSIDIHDVDESKFPLFRSVDFTEAMLSPGDVLCIPPGFWCQEIAQTYTASVRWSIPFQKEISNRRTRQRRAVRTQNYQKSLMRKAGIDPEVQSISSIPGLESREAVHRTVLLPSYRKRSKSEESEIPVAYQEETLLSSSDIFEEELFSSHSETREED